MRKLNHNKRRKNLLSRRSDDFFNNSPYKWFSNNEIKAAKKKYLVRD